MTLALIVTLCYHHHYLCFHSSLSKFNSLRVFISSSLVLQPGAYYLSSPLSFFFPTNAVDDVTIPTPPISIHQRSLRIELQHIYISATSRRLERPSNLCHTMHEPSSFCGRLQRVSFFVTHNLQLSSNSSFFTAPIFHVFALTKYPTLLYYAHPRYAIHLPKLQLRKS